MLLACAACEQREPPPSSPPRPVTAPIPDPTSSSAAARSATPAAVPAASGVAKSSCDMRAERGTCLEGFAEPKTRDVKDCENDIVKGKYAKTPCPREGTLGVCTLHDGDRRHYYIAPARDGFGATVQGARADCEGMNAEFAALGKKQTFTAQ